MNIQINKTYRIASDQHSWHIETLRKDRGKTRWKAIQWYTSLDQCVNGLANLMLRTSEARTLAEALAEVENVSRQLTLALAPEFEVRRSVVNE